MHLLCQVVQVPLGTMVWRMVQLRGGDTPHGVTALTQPSAAAAAGQHTPPHQGQVQQPWRRPPAAPETAPGQQEASAGSGSSSSGQHTRKRLFRDSQLECASDTSAAAGAAGTVPSSVSTAVSTGAEIYDSSSEAQQQQDEAEQGGLDSLYDDLVQCRVVLSNQEKLQLLQTGCLGGPASAAGMRDWEDSSEQEQSGSSGSDSEVEESDQEEDDWGGQQQGSAAHHHMMLGDDDEAAARHFDKQQVISCWC